MIDESALPYSEVTCEGKAEDILLLPCAGGSNCGQITNNVAVKLTQDGVGRIYCLAAGIGAHIEGRQKPSGCQRRPVIVGLLKFNRGGKYEST